MDCCWSRHVFVRGLALRHEERIGRMFTSTGNNISGCHSQFGRQSGGNSLPSQFGVSKVRCECGCKCYSSNGEELSSCARCHTLPPHGTIDFAVADTAFGHLVRPMHIASENSPIS